jgi:hypothetical protein
MADARLVGLPQHHPTRTRVLLAAQLLRRAMAIADQGWGIAHPVSLRPRRLLGTCLGRDRRYPAAEEILVAAYRLAGDAGEYAPRQQSEMAGALAGLYEAWGRGEIAARYRAESRRRMAVSHWPLAISQYAIAVGGRGSRVAGGTTMSVPG